MLAVVNQQAGNKRVTPLHNKNRTVLFKSYCKNEQNIKYKRGRAETACFLQSRAARGGREGCLCFGNLFFSRSRAPKRVTHL